MQLANRRAGRCFSCALRQHLHILQARRLKSTSDKAVSPGPRITYHQGRVPPERRREGEVFGKSGVVRKFWNKESSLELFDERKNPRADFKDILKKRLEAIREELRDAPILEHLGKDGGSFSQIWRAFTQKMSGSPRPFFASEEDEGQIKNVAQDLKEAYQTRGVYGLDDRIKYAFYGHVTGSRFTESDIKNQQTLADLRYPTEWFPATRAMHRKIHLHVGPTNSGKTYHALQRLEQAEKGVYAGPLRLLAHEVYTRMNAKGKRCALVTGEERRVPDESAAIGNMLSCTVEMVPLNDTLDVAVIDEIQMIGNIERGWAWTQALLGVKAKEVHLCGEERTVPLIRELCASVGEKLEIHKYERLSPLKVMDQSLDGELKKLRKGDCIVSFSVMGIHALRRQIERATGRKVATVYGSLPPETRAQQARLFNDPNNDYDFLVASDAIGMGLNLSIKRIIFESSSKFDGVQRRTLTVADIKQIAGRAGRYRTAEQATQAPAALQALSVAKGDTPIATAPPAKIDYGQRATPQSGLENTGFVTTLEKFDFPVVVSAMTAEPEPIRTAGLFPPGPVLERFASYFPRGTPFSFILTRLHELSMMHHRFHLCGLRDQVWIADLIEPVRDLTTADRNIFCAAPAAKGDMDLWRHLMPAYARCVAEQRSASIVDFEELPLETLEAEVEASREYLRELERLHKGVVTYLWLSYRFAGIFNARPLAFHVKELVEGKIETVLGQFSFSEASRRKIAASRERKMIEALRVEVGGEGEGGVVEEGDAGAVDRQSGVTAGRDRFGGEEDISVAEPGMDESVGGFSEQLEGGGVLPAANLSEDRSTTSSESEATYTGMDTIESSGKAQTPAAERRTSESTPPPYPTEDSSTPAMTDEAEPAKAAFLTMTPETEKSTAPMRTQEAPPEPVEPRTPDEGREASRPAGRSRFGGVPIKHLGGLDVDTTEAERRIGQRP